MVKNSRWFEDTIFRLKGQYNIVRAEDLLQFQSGQKTREKNCQLTFDDGDISFYKIIFPVLKKHRIPATLFVSPKICRERSNFWFQEIEVFKPQDVRKIISLVTGILPEKIQQSRIDTILKTMRLDLIREILDECRKKFPHSPLPFQNINFSQLREIDSSGLITIGAHTLNHPILYNEDAETSYLEIKKSIDELAEMLNHKIRFFAYPNGIPGMDFSGREKSYLSQCGISLAFKNESEDILEDYDPMSISRIAVSEGESIRRINFKLHSPGLWYSLKKMNPAGEYRERQRLSDVLRGNTKHIVRDLTHTTL